jgi:hypothetical protein
MIDDELPDVDNQFFHLFARGVVGELQEESLATLGSEAEVFDRRVYDRAARNCHQRVVRRSDASAAEADVLDRTFARSDPDGVADTKRLLQCDKQRTDEISDRALSRQRDSETSHA